MRQRTTALPLQFGPLTLARWKDLAKLFGSRGGCGGCWCMAWRLAPNEVKAGKGSRNRRRLRELAAKKPPPGVLAYTSGEPVGWCSVAPREEFVHLSRSRVLRPIDERRVWSVTCLLVARPFRRQGVSVALLREAVKFARREGADVVEGYPVEPYSAEMPPVFAWTGTAAAFKAAGFVEVARGSPKRPIFRCYIDNQMSRMS